MDSSKDDLDRDNELQNKKNICKHSFPLFYVLCVHINGNKYINDCCNHCHRKDN
jgi:hypothetical protein